MSDSCLCCSVALAVRSCLPLGDLLPAAELQRQLLELCPTACPPDRPSLHCQTLHRPPTPTDCLKYYGFELGAMVNYDKKSGNSIVNGAHDAGRLSELLEGFIKK